MQNVIQKSVLVVDDDDAFRLTLKTCLESQGYKVTMASDGKMAQHLIAMQQFDCIISDIRMPHVTGIELLHFVKRTKPTPFVLMTGFAELTETKEAYDLGADEFIAKPFKREELLEIVRACCTVEEKAKAKDENVNVDEEYCRINIDDFISGREIQCDVYIRLSASKFVKIAHQGEDIPIERIRAYKEKKIQHLFMTKEAFRKYVDFNITLAGALKTSSKVAKIKKLNFMKHTGELILEHFHNDKIDKESFEDAKSIVETSISVLNDQKDLFDLLNILNNHGDALYAHSLGVSMYAAMIARQLKWTSPVSMFKISVGGLLHDIGKKEIDPTLLVKSRKDMTPEEIKTYESHATRGLEILGGVPSIPSDVLQIVLQHHENSLGTGYPAGLKKNHIHPMARLITVADEFCKLVIKTKASTGMPPQEALQRMVALYTDMLDPAPFKALMQVFSMTPPEGFGEPRKAMGGRAA